MHRFPGARTVHAPSKQPTFDRLLIGSHFLCAIGSNGFFFGAQGHELFGGGPGNRNASARDSDKRAQASEMGSHLSGIHRSENCCFRAQDSVSVVSQEKQRRKLRKVPILQIRERPDDFEHDDMSPGPLFDADSSEDDEATPPQPPTKRPASPPQAQADAQAMTSEIVTSAETEAELATTEDHTSEELGSLAKGDFCLVFHDEGWQPAVVVKV